MLHSNTIPSDCHIGGPSRASKWEFFTSKGGGKLENRVDAYAEEDWTGGGGATGFAEYTVLGVWREGRVTAGC